MATKKTTKSTTAKAAEPKAAPAKKATAAKSTRVAKKAKPAEAPVAEDLFAAPAPVAAKPAPKAPKAKAEKAEKAVRVTFRVRAEIGSKVYLAGCFNDWNPSDKPMTDKKGDGEFTCTLTLPKGRYEYKFVINGTWCADPECTDWVQNNMGTLNSVKVVD